jgi:tRNA A37 methylthiotransferase MiaB
VTARALGDELTREWASTLVGSNADVLVERVAGGRAEGTSSEYVRVSFSVPDGAWVAVGDIERVAVAASEGAVASGERIDPGSRARP